MAAFGFLRCKCCCPQPNPRSAQCASCFLVIGAREYGHCPAALLSYRGMCNVTAPLEADGRNYWNPFAGAACVTVWVRSFQPRAGGEREPVLRKRNRKWVT